MFYTPNQIPLEEKFNNNSIFGLMTNGQKHFGNLIAMTSGQLGNNAIIAYGQKEPV